MENKGLVKSGDTLCMRYSELDGMRILLVEDNPINVAVTKRVLSRWEVDVTVASNGLIAVEKVRNGLYDLILMDVDMPVMDGLTASREIRKFNLHTPIIVLTSNTNEFIRNSFWELGIYDILYKPLDLEHLYQTMQKYAIGMLVAAS